MKFSPALSACLMAFSAISATAAPLESEPTTIDFQKASGMKEFKDGIYTLKYKDDDSPSIDYAPIDDTVDLNSTAPSRLIARDAGCDNISLPHGDTDNANAQLQAKCGNGLKNTVWIRVNDVVAFYCQYAEAAMCSATESQNANKWITQKCGAYGAGSYTGDHYAYGYTNPKLHSFCGIWLS